MRTFKNMKFFRSITAFFKLITSERNRFRFAVVLSILLHLLMLVLSDLNVINVYAEDQIVQVEEEEKRLAFEIVESNPDYAVETPPENTDLVSDKNTIASDNTPGVTSIEDRPLTEGIADSKELPAPQTIPEEMLNMRSLAPTKKFDFSELTRPENNKSENQEEQKQQTNREQIKAVMPDNREASARELGGLSLSTYAWDFAPYMLKLKRKIGRNINPPIAFTDLGIINGKYVIQFVITRKGELKSLILLDSVGDQSLEKTSIDAIRFSKPFDPLPEDFPDDILTITGTFNFLIRRNV